MSHEIFEQLPAGAQAEIQRGKASVVEVSFANSEFEDISNKSAQRTALRLIHHGRLSSVSSSKPQSEQALLDRAMASAPFGSPVNYDFPGAAPLAEIPMFDPAVPELDSATMVDMADDLVQSLVAYDRRIQVMAGVGRSVREVSLQNSAGFAGSFRQTGWQLALGGILVQGDDMLWLGESQSSCELRQDFAPLKQTVKQQFIWAKETVAMEPGSYPVIFVPDEVQHLITPFLASLNGKQIARGLSPWIGKLGHELLDKRVTLLDDGTLPYHPSSRPFDREGVPTSRQALIEQGVAKQYLLDLQSAHELGLSPTGNGAEGGPSPHHLLLSPGQTALADLIGRIDRGLIIYSSMGAWAGNPLTGNVSGTISMGLKIERGQIVGRVKDCMFSLNSFDHFRNRLIDCSRETKQIGQATYPYVALDEVVVSTK